MDKILHHAFQMPMPMCRNQNVFGDLKKSVADLHNSTIEFFGKMIRMCSNVTKSLLQFIVWG
jgi:hypothetical protein